MRYFPQRHALGGGFRGSRAFLKRLRSSLEQAIELRELARQGVESVALRVGHSAGAMQSRVKTVVFVHWFKFNPRRNRSYDGIVTETL